MITPGDLRTPRLRLRRWTDDDRDDFARMNADPEVMRDLGGPLSRTACDRKLDDYMNGFERHGYSRWLIETTHHDDTSAGRFVGYAGVHARTNPDHPLGPHAEIGWRLNRARWGNGYATEAAKAALADAIERVGLTEVLSYTSADNHRSQAVMERLNLQRDQSRDFVVHYPELGKWAGLVWATTKPDG